MPRPSAPSMQSDSRVPLGARSRRRLRVGAGAALAAAIVFVAGTTIHLPEYSAGPGPARDVGALIRIPGRQTFASKGAFLLTTVSVSDRTISLFEALHASLDPAVSGI